MRDRDVALQYLTGALEDGARPASIGRKFAPDGTVLSTPGNTTICHIDPQSAAYGHLVAAQDALRAGPVADAFTFLPPASLHMTIFEGVIEYSRTRARWPEHLPVDASIDAVSQDFGTRLRAIGLAQHLRARPVGIFGGFSVDMTGTDAAAEALLRQTRDQLRMATGIKRTDHDNYGFHITLGYLLRWLTPAEANAVLDHSDQVAQALVAQVPSIDLGPVEFCRFDTMHHFETCHLID